MTMRSKGLPCEKTLFQIFFVLVMFCSVVGEFSASHVDHIIIVNQTCCQLNVMHKNNDLIIFIVILKAD